MIEKLFPRLLNNSSDSRVRKATEMSDALNVQVGGESAGGDSTGDMGVLKPINGNNPVEDSFIGTNSTKRVIGKAEDSQQNRVYYFVYSSNAEEQGVYVYDNVQRTVNEVFTSEYFNFQSNGFVKGDVVHLNNQTDVDAEERTVLYFTDNVNEPRKLDVDRALEDSFVSYNQYDFADFITACPRTPVPPPTFSFSYDPDSQVNNFEGLNGFQFAYQNIYFGGEESALSTYSDIAIPPSYVNQGNLSLSSINVDNVCTITIPRDGYTREIEKVRLLGRYGNEGNFYIIEDIDPNPNFAEDTTYEFRNDQVITAIPLLESDKQFDALPKRAQAQAVTENRLFYGNYVEGFDNYPVTATLTAVYNEREEDFFNTSIGIEPIVLELDTLPNTLDALNNRVAGFKLDLSSVPSSIPAGSEYTFTMTVGPDRNWHIYDARFGMHATRQLYNVETGEMSTNPIVPGANVDDTIRDSGYKTGRSYFGGLQLTLGIPYNPGFSNENDNLLKWNVEIGEQASSAPIPVAYGTSATNPLIVKGGVVTFIVRLTTESENTRLNLRNAICRALSGESISNTGFVFQEDQSDVSPSYEFNLGLSHGDSIANNSNNPLAKLVVAVGDRSFLQNGITPNVAPCGYFVVNSASVSLRCRNFLNVSEYNQSPQEAFIALDIDSIDETDVKTVVPDVPLNPIVGNNSSSTELQLDINKFVVLDPDLIANIDLNFIQENFEHQWYSDLYNEVQLDGIGLISLSASQAAAFGQSGSVSLADTETRIDSQIARVFGSLVIPPGSKLYQSTRNRAENTNDVDSFSLFNNYALSLVDGSGGPGGGFVNSLFNQQTFDALDPIVVGGIGPTSYFYKGGSISRSVFRYGSINRNAFGYLPTENFNWQVPTIPYFFPNRDTPIGPLSYDYEGDQGDESSVEAVSSASFLSSIDDTSVVSRSFKSSANHDFGVVYYDQRGRSSNVNPIGSVYVAGYSAAERDPGLEGRVNVRVQLQEEAPDWAFHYQIVYGGNSSVDKFVQYTTGGAFVPTDSNEEQNIFVSLNYLQNNDDVSYVDAFGARSPEGNNRLYEFREGDKLRVISYYNQNEQRVFPTNYVFDVVGLRDLGEDPDGNPLTNDDQSVPQAKQGDFIVLRNNPTASGFRYADVQAANGVFETFEHYWGNRCVVEIFSPSLSQGEEERVFYEVSEAYPVERNDDGQTVHSNTDITLTNGDVWWRRMAVNMPDLKADVTGYVNLVGGDTGDGSTAPSFRAYQLESPTFSDLVRNADVYSYGKVKAILPNSREVRRRSSVTFGEGNNYASKLVRFTSFNPSLFPFKDLPNRYGAVNYLEAFNEFLLIIQEDKLSRLPVSRQILSDAAGGQQLIASDVILGTQVFYSGDFGCDGNPESVVVVDNDIYFANKSVAEVYRFNRTEGGVRVISDNGMEEFFERLFRDVGVDARIVGGYDPLNDEFLISIFNPTDLPAASPSSVLQPFFQDVEVPGGGPVIDGGPIVDDGGETTGGGDTPPESEPGGGVVIDDEPNTDGGGVDEQAPGGGPVIG